MSIPNEQLDERIDERIDEQLIANYKASGTTADLDELFERHLGKVRNVAFRIVLCNATADDITQEVFVKVIRSMHTFRGQASFSTWLYRITVNTVREHLRKRSHVHKFVEHNQTTDEQQADERQSERQSERPEQAAIFGETVIEVEQALAKLSAKLRTAIVLTAIEHLSPKEAAAIEGCSMATMHWRIHQARKQLKQLLH